MTTERKLDRKADISLTNHSRDEWTVWLWVEDETGSDWRMVSESLVYGFENAARVMRQFLETGYYYSAHCAILSR